MLLAVTLVAWDLSAVPEAVGAGDFGPATELPPLPSEEEPQRELNTAEPEGDVTKPPPLVSQEGRTPKGGFDGDESEKLDEFTSPTFEVFENKDGSHTARVNSVPVRYQDETGAWRDINLNLDPAPGGGFEAKASPLPMVIPADPKEGLARWESPAGPVTLGAPDVTPSLDAPRAKDHDAIWEHVDGLEVRGRFLVSGFEQDLVLPKPGGPGSYRIELRLPQGVTVRPLENFGVELVDAAGEVIAAFGGGHAYDSSGKLPVLSQATPATTTLVDQIGGVATMEVTVDPVWLADPARVYPVTIDPTFEPNTGTGGGYDTWVDFLHPTSASGWSDQHLKVGAWTQVSGQHGRAFLFFNLLNQPNGPPSWLLGPSVTVWSATLGLHNVASNGGLGHPMNVEGLGGGFGSSTTYNNQPPGDGKGVRSNFDWQGSNPFGGADFIDFDAKSLAESWLHDGQTNFGMRLIEADGADQASGKIFSSGNAGFYAPRLEITWDQGPPASIPEAPADDVTVPTLTPSLSVQPQPLVQYWFRISTSKDANNAPSGNIIADSGLRNDPNWTIDPGALVDSGTYYWTVYTQAWGQSVPTRPNWIRKFTVKLRLGSTSPSPYDQAGPVGVNLANGNLTATAASPTFPTVGGDVGLTYTYDSQTPPSKGLTGRYYNNKNVSGQVAAQHVDPTIAFQWNYGGPSAGVAGDGFSVRWDGYFTAPSAGFWKLGAASDDGVRIWLNNQLILDRWFDQSTWGVPNFNGGVNLTQGQTVPVRIEYYDNVGGAFLALWYSVGPVSWLVSGDWLSPTAAALPRGWNVSADLDGSLAYTSFVRFGPYAIFKSPDGTHDSYLFQNGTWIPPAGEHGHVANTNLPVGGLILHAEDGYSYLFNAAGGLEQTRSSLDDKRPAAPTYTWSGDPARLTKIVDPVSSPNRQVTLTYGGGTCGAQPTGFDSVPNGMLCKVAYWDGTQTLLHYKQGQLARIVDPGGTIPKVTDFGYEQGKLTTIRDPLASDAVAAGVRANDDTTYTEVTYVDERVSEIKLPAPNVGAARPQRNYAYGGGSTSVTTAGINGDRVVTFDGGLRGLTDTDPTGRQSTSAWDPIKERKVSSTDAASLTTTTVYDHADRPTDGYGPAPAAWFGADNKPLPAYTSQVPRTQTRYDEGLSSLAVAYWNDKNMGGMPIQHSTGIGEPSGQIYKDWGQGGPPGVQSNNWAARLTGEILLPASGIYEFVTGSDDGVRLWVDDQLIIDWWKDGPNQVHSGFYNNTSGPNVLKKIRLEYYDNTSSAYLSLWWKPPGAGSLVVVPGGNLRPRYGLPTSATDADGKTTATQYAMPHLGLPTATVVDPGGLALTTATGYEPDSTDKYWRRISRTLPAGNQWAYTYYSRTATAAACGGPSAHQGGTLQKRTAPDPDGSPQTTARVEESVYDAAGRVVASRIGNEPWTCTTYDARGRPTQRIIPPYGAQQGQRTVTYTHALNGNPLTARVEDPAGQITATVDLLGRTTEVVDVWGKTTSSTYDQAGRVVETNGPAGTVQTDYDAGGRPTAVRLDGQTVAVPVYDGAGRLDSTAYPSGGGNGTSLAPIGRDVLGRTTGLTWLDPTAAPITSDVVTRTVGGDITDQSIDGIDADPVGPNFTYDNAGRLTEASVPGHELTYSYNASGGCGALPTAGKNTNRTASTDTTALGTTAATYCYDQADRLTATTLPGLGGIEYDSHGNTTRLGDQTMGYDGADRHLTTNTDDDRATVTYTRDAADNIVARTDTYLAPIELRASATATTAPPSTLLTIPTPAGVEGFDVLVAHVVTDGTTTITAPSGWDLVADTANGTAVRTTTYTRVATGSEPASWDFALSAAAAAGGGIAAYTGVDGTNPVDVSASATSDPVTPTAMHVAPAVTTTTPGTQLVNLFGLGAPTDLTPDPLTTEQYDLNTGASGITSAMADATIAPAGNTGTRTATSTASALSASHTIALRPAAATTTQRYTAGATLDANNQVIERIVDLPGGATITKRGSSDVWSYPNIHGDTVATADSNGTKQGSTHTYDPYGQAIGDVPDNRDGNLDYGWIGKRPTEHTPGLEPIIEMGARQYHPALGRFLEVDPIEGGSANDYEYAGGDPVNAFDLDGTKNCKKGPDGKECRRKKKIRRLRRIIRNSDIQPMYKVAKARAKLAKMGVCEIKGGCDGGLDINISISGCVVLCGSFTLQGGRVYAGIGGPGVATPSVAVGFTSAPPEQQSSGPHPIVGGQWGAGGYVETGSTNSGGGWSGGGVYVTPGMGVQAGVTVSTCVLFCDP